MPKPAKNAEYEVIEHSVIRSFKLSLVEVLHRAPHIHGELEIGFLLEGEAEAICDGKRLRLTAPDFYIANPFSLHETRVEKPVVFLSLQVLASFFREHYPEMGSVRFEFTSGKAALQHPQQAYFQRVYDFVLSIARHYFMGETGFSLYCAGKMNHLFYDLIKLHPYTTVSEVWQDTARLGRIDSYIQEHYDKKLLLAEVAQREGLSLSYLSHYFREHWGEPFQATFCGCDVKRPASS